MQSLRFYFKKYIYWKISMDYILLARVRKKFLTIFDIDRAIFGQFLNYLEEY